LVAPCRKAEDGAVVRGIGDAFRPIHDTNLGRVDGFHQDKAAGEGDDGDVTLGCFPAVWGKAFEAFRLADSLLDPGAAVMQAFGKEGRTVLGTV
jgi:hypothetical protein